MGAMMAKRAPMMCRAALPAPPENYEELYAMMDVGDDLCFGAEGTSDDDYLCDHNGVGYGAAPKKFCGSGKGCGLGFGKARGRMMPHTACKRVSKNEAQNQNRMVITSNSTIPFFTSWEDYNVDYDIDELKHYQKLTIR